MTSILRSSRSRTMYTPIFEFSGFEKDFVTIIKAFFMATRAVVFGNYAESSFYFVLYVSRTTNSVEIAYATFEEDAFPISSLFDRFMSVLSHHLFIIVTKQRALKRVYPNWYGLEYSVSVIDESC